MEFKASVKKKKKNKTTGTVLTGHSELFNHLRPQSSSSNQSSQSSNIKFEIASSSHPSNSSPDSDNLKEKFKTEGAFLDHDSRSKNSENSDQSSLETKKSRQKSFIHKITHPFSTQDKHKNISLSKPLTSRSSIPEELNVIYISEENSNNDLILPSEDCQDNTGSMALSSTSLYVESDAETMHNEDENYSTDEYPTKEYIDSDEKKVQIVQDVSNEDIWLFISDSNKYDILLISNILSALRNSEIRNLYHDFGYDKTIIFFIVLKNVLSGNLVIDASNVLHCYRTVNEIRMEDHDFYDSISSKSSEILSLKKRLNTILKARTFNSLKCLKCKIENVSLLFLPCGHIILCGHCNDNNDVCASCGSNITESHQVFL